MAFEFNILGKTVYISRAYRKDFKPRLYLEPYATQLVWNKLFISIFKQGKDTYEQDWSDIDICTDCGEHSSEVIDVRNGESLGSNCCGAGTPYLD